MLERNPKDLKLVFKNFPLPSHPFARKAALAALAANRQGKFWEYNHALFENSAQLNDARLDEIAKKLGLNMAKFDKDRIDPALERIIDRDIQEGVQAEVQGTPTLFVDGKVVKNRSLEGLQQMIEAEAKKHKK